MKRAFIIHGWEGYSEEGWFPWLKRELEAKGFTVEVPSMPNTDEPDMNVWINHLKELVGTIDEDTYFFGHSMGCQAILRFLEQSDSTSGPVILVAGFVHLKGLNEEEREIVKEWLNTPIDFKNITASKISGISVQPSSPAKCILSF